MPLHGLILGVLDLVAAFLGGGQSSMSKVEMAAILSGRTAVGTDPRLPFRQYFDPTGETTFVPGGGSAEVGEWQLMGGQYCSRWAGAGWDRYDMTKDGETVAWLNSANGDVYRARMVDGNALR